MSADNMAKDQRYLALVVSDESRTHIINMHTQTRWPGTQDAKARHILQDE